MDMQNIVKVLECARLVRNRLGAVEPGSVGIVLGTGLGGFADTLTEARIPYAEIPGFPVSTVQSHAGALIQGRVGGRQVLALCGRFHLYEGYDPKDICLGVRTLAALGVGTVILTNAAGALDPRFCVGDLMCIADHLNWTGRTPLSGPNRDEWGCRFPDMRQVWSPRLISLAMETALTLGIRLEKGVYLQTPGPQMETPAETRAYRMLGADAVGMSTVIEAIALHHMGVELLGISCLTNKNLPDCMEEASLETVIARATEGGERLSRLLGALIPLIPEPGGERAGVNA